MILKNLFHCAKKKAFFTFAYSLTHTPSFGGPVLSRSGVPSDVPHRFGGAATLAYNDPKFCSGIGNVVYVHGDFFADTTVPLS